MFGSILAGFALTVMQAGGAEAANASNGSPALPEWARVAPGEVLVIGEVHGSKEVPAAFLDLVDRTLARSKTVSIGLEMPANAVAARCPIDSSEALGQFWTRKGQDGRSSQAMRRLVCELQERVAQGAVRLVFLEREPRDPKETARAVAAEAAITGAPMLILIGNFHARNTPSSLVGLLRANGLQVTSLTTSSPDATTWNCGPEGCSARPMPMNFCVDEPAAPYRLSTAIRDKRWDGCMVLPRLTASPPAEV